MTEVALPDKGETLKGSVLTLLSSQGEMTESDRMNAYIYIHIHSLPIFVGWHKKILPKRTFLLYPITWTRRQHYSWEGCSFWYPLFFLLIRDRKEHISASGRRQKWALMRPPQTWALMRWWMLQPHWDSFPWKTIWEWKKAPTQVFLSHISSGAL